MRYFVFYILDDAEDVENPKSLIRRRPSKAYHIEEDDDYVTNSGNPESTTTSAQANSKSCWPKQARELDRLAIIAMPLLYLVICVVYWLSYLSMLVR